MAFGRALGWMSSPSAKGPPGPGVPPSIDSSNARLMDVHGTGAQRSDPAQFPRGRGLQGDVIRIYNHVRLVRG